MHASHVKSEISGYKNNSKYAWLICLVASLFFFYEFLQLNVFDPISQEISHDFGINTTKLGYLSSLYFYGNCLMVIPAGLLLDRLSTKKIIFFAMLLCTVVTFIFAMTSSFYVAAVCRFLEGMGAGFCFLSAIRLASRWFTANHLAFVTGVIVTMAMLGGMVAQTPMAILSDHFGWRHAMLANGVLGVIIIFLVLLIVKDRPDADAVEQGEEEAHLKQMGVMKSLMFVVKNKNNWLAGLYTTLMNLPIFILGALWGILYLQQVDGLTHAEASYVTSMLFIGVVFGSPFFGWFSDKIRSRRKPMVLGAITSLIVVLVIMYVPHLTLTSLLILSFLLGFTTSSQVITYPAVAELNPIEITGSAVSIISVTIMFSGVVVQPLTGWLIQLHWDHVMQHGHPVYLAGDFMSAMMIMPISFVISLVLAFMIKETGCRAEYEHL
jgi:MFS family permease